MKKLLLVFVFAILSSCSVEQNDVVCGEIVVRTEALEGNAWTWYLKLETSRDRYIVFEVDSDTYYSSYIGEYICLR